MKISIIISHLFYIIFISIILFSQSCSNQAEQNADKIKLYICEKTQEKADPELFINQKPVLILDKEDILKVNLIHEQENWLDLEIELTEETGEILKRITSENIDRRIVFILNNQILFAAVILTSIDESKFLISSAEYSEREKAEEMARNFSNSIEYIDKRPIRDDELDPELRKAIDLLNKEGISAIKILEQLIKQQEDQNKRFFLYQLVANTYMLSKDHFNTAKTYRNLIQEDVDINPNNYMIIAQAYSYLSRFEKKQRNINLSKNYLNKAIDTYRFIEKNFPSTQSAEWASIAIGSFELISGNFVEAQKRAEKAKQGQGDLKVEGYVLMGLSYEFQNEFEKAKKEYEQVIKEFPNSHASYEAKEWIKNLEKNKTNFDEVKDMIGDFP